MAASLEERYKIIGDNLKNERIRKKLTQVDLAAKMYSSERVVRRHEKGEPMKMETLFAYANALECSCEDLFNERKGSDAQIQKAFEEAEKLPKDQRDLFLNLLSIA